MKELLKAKIKNLVSGLVSSAFCITYLVMCISSHLSVFPVIVLSILASISIGYSIIQYEEIEKYIDTI